MKKSAILLITIVVSAVLIYYYLPLKYFYKSEIDRGNELIISIDNYLKENGDIPSANNWEVLTELGFKPNEMARAFPTIQKINKSTYELIFIVGFDPPYLMWNSKERVWKEDFPSTPRSY